MKNSILFTISIIILSFLCNTNNVFAQTVAGRIILSSISDNLDSKIQSINGVSFQNQLFKARVETKDKNSPFNGVKGVYENWIIPMGNGNNFIHGVAVMADKDGDTYIVYFTSTKKEGMNTLYAKGGTGKFQNLDGQGTSLKAAPADTGIKEDYLILTWEFTYKM